MGKLAIRQGDVLFFARSLVWKAMAMTHDDILTKPEHVRFEALWNTLKATGNFVPSQEEADRIAAMYNVKAPRVIQASRGGSIAKSSPGGLTGGGFGNF